MNLPDVPLFSMLRDRMSWLHQRQDVLSQNVANADTPGYVARDLKAQDFSNALSGQTTRASALTATDPRHIGMSSLSSSHFDEMAAPDQSNPNGNAVSLEEEMIKVSDTQ